MLQIKCIVSVILLVIVFKVSKSQAISVWDDLTLTEKEKHSLEKFKELMNDVVTQDYMRKDIYLIKWLRAQSLDLQKAERMLRQHLKWREEFRMDTIIDEDFGDIIYQYPYSTDGLDYEGRPVLAINTADWDIRRGILSGQKDTLIRWAFRAYEIGRKRIRDLQDQGQNVTQFDMLCNFDSFNLVQHACINCVEVIVNFLIAYELNYPGMAHAIIAIKTPATFDIVLRALKRVMSKDTADAISIWGPNRDEWQTNLLKIIPKDQLDEDFGGTRNLER